MPLDGFQNGQRASILAFIGSKTGSSAVRGFSKFTAKRVWCSVGTSPFFSGRPPELGAEDFQESKQSF